MTTAIDLGQETNPWQAQAARFETAARKLNLDEGLKRVLQSPAGRSSFTFRFRWMTDISKSLPAIGCSIRLRAVRRRAEFVLRPM